MMGWRHIICVLCVCVSVCFCESSLSGKVHSPLYPKAYPSDLFVQWKLEVPKGYRIQLTFIHFDVEPSNNCCNDSVMVLYGQKILGKYCGQDNSANGQDPGKEPILSPGNHLQLVFQTDGSNAGSQQHLGFSAFYQAVDVDECSSPNPEGGSGPLCSQICLNTIGSYFCDCNHGYQLQPDQRTCLSAIDCDEPKLLPNGGFRFLSDSQNHSVIQYHCNEPYYAFPGAQNISYTCAADGKRTVNDHNDIIIPPCLPVCGNPSGIPGSRQRVLGGKNAPAGTFPWQVLLSVTGRGGAIVIGEQWIMTAANNLVSGSGVTPKESVRLYVGHNDVKERINNPPLEIASIHIHPQYQGNNNFDNDIALIKLARPLTFNSEVQPLCLPPEGAKYERSGWVSGFGYTEEMSISNELRYIVLPLVDQTECRNSFERLKQQKIEVMPFTDNMFCAGLTEGGADTCSGDTGSAFVLKDRESDRYWVAGIVSWGIQCGEKGRYGVYTRVSRYVEWINKIMRDN
ncbi:complement component 1, r subcomponent [Chanos chanos]|uniref:Complement component 1, r subcomponent n=1 Tax=Chanos chanos TaxID=29144 RepID=A0A6J2W301_CHACN|nr:complement C1r subcomponent-like [Chanos chanos]